MNTVIKEKVLNLRKKGLTYSEINQKLSTNIPKSTLSYWCKYVTLPETYQKKIKQLKLVILENARKEAILAKKQVQKSRIEAIINKNEYLKQDLNKNTCKLLLSILYLGEGAKYCHTRCIKIGSSQAVVIKLLLKLLNNCYNIDNEKYKIQIICRADQNIKTIERYWQTVTGFKPQQFYQTRIDKRTIGKKTLKKDYQGVCVIHYFDTDIQLELETLSFLVESWI